jgi:hypothetical protein
MGQDSLLTQAPYMGLNAKILLDFKCAKQWICSKQYRDRLVTV